MTTHDGAPDGSWPDREERGRWHEALTQVVVRLREERGIDEPWRLPVDGGALWVEYGDLRLRVAGEGAELHDPDELFAEVDSWVAFDRPAGPGRVLDRDRKAMAAWRDRLPAVRQFWEDVARRVLRDVGSTTDLSLTWKVVVREDGPAWPAIPGGPAWPVGGVLAGASRLVLPAVWLETPWMERSLPELTDVAEATGHLADLVQEAVIEEVHGAWPPCPRHPHPLEVGYTDDGGAVWSCPQTPDVTMEVGGLDGPAAPRM